MHNLGQTGCIFLGRTQYLFPCLEQGRAVALERVVAVDAGVAQGLFLQVGVAPAAEHEQVGTGVAGRVGGDDLVEGQDFLDGFAAHILHPHEGPGELNHAAVELSQDDLREEAALFAFQTLLLLLRDSDLRAVRPHHVTPVDLPGYPATPVLTFHQAKTGDEVRVPLPPAAAAIWQQWAGRPPVPVQQERNRRMKQLARVAQLTRPFVRVQYVRGEATEEVLTLYKVITTHTARHTGADLLMLGSGGDSNLKEKALLVLTQLFFRLPYGNAMPLFC